MNSDVLSNSNEKNDTVYKLHLYNLQQRAPKPSRIICQHEVTGRPQHYGREYFGDISHPEAVNRVRGTDGNYLIRKSLSNPNNNILVIWFEGRARNYRVYYVDGKHYVAEKRFHTLYDLVYDGLICFYLESHAGDYMATMHDNANYYRSVQSRYVSTMRAKRRLKNRPDIRHGMRTESFLPASVGEYAKKHNFKTYSFKFPTWCDFCNNYLWGIISQGVKCLDCGLSAHIKCSFNVPDECSPELKYVKRMFGVDLTALVKSHQVLVPTVIEKCILEIERRGGINHQGLYRLAGSHEQIERLRALFDEYGDDTEIDDSFDINAITSTVKLFLRLLPIPLITYDTYKSFIIPQTKRDYTVEEKLHLTKTALVRIPPAHYNSLQYLMMHLHRVADKSAVNKMTAENLGIIFAPTLMRSPELDPVMALTNAKYEQSLMTQMILKEGELFTEQPDAPPPTVFAT